MGDLYRIEITDKRDDEVQARLVLISTQSCDLPAKKNIALQVVTETFYDLHSSDHEFFNAYDPEQLARFSELDSFQQRVCLTRLAFHHDDRYALFRREAETCIVWVKSLGDGNFDAVDAWEQSLYAGEVPEREPWTELRFKVAVPSWIEHISVGDRVNSRMFDKTE